MNNVLTDPIFLTVIAGPVAGYIWSKFLDNNHGGKPPSGSVDQSVDLSGSNINNSGTMQTGSNNRIQNVTNHYQAPRPVSGDGQAEMFFAGMVAVIVTIAYLTYPVVSLMAVLSAVLFCFAFTWSYSEAVAAKLYKSGLYFVLLYALYSVWHTPVPQEYLDTVSHLKGGGLKGYFHFAVSGFPGIPFDIFLLALQQAGALFMVIVMAHVIRVTSFSVSVRTSVQMIPIMTICAFSPLYILYQQEASQFIFQMVW
jgi:hypothetical protein